jgi:hypothetical protein
VGRVIALAVVYATIFLLILGWQLLKELIG